MTDSITVKDVARKAGVSVGTVSRVLNNHSNVTEESRDRVMKAAISLGYKNLASKVLPSRSLQSIKEIGFLFCSPLSLHKGGVLSNPFWPYILNGVQDEARLFGIKVTYRDMGDIMQTAQESLSIIRGMKLDGILLTGFVEPEVIPLVKSLNIPLVALVNHLPGYGIDSIDSDDFEGARMAVRYLVKNGHRQIAYISGPMPSISYPASVDLRYTGYCTALLDAGLPINHDLIEHSDFSTDGGYQACQRLLELGVPFTALFCTSDSTAVGAMKAFRKAGRRVPEDISVIGFDNIDLAEHMAPALTTLHFNKEALGMIAVRHLLERVENPTKIGTSTFVDVELIERDSVRSLLAS